MVLSFKFELSESILKQLIKYLFHTCLLLFRFKSKYGCSISSKIKKLFYISNIYYLEVKRLSQILYHYWTIPLSTSKYKMLVMSKGRKMRWNRNECLSENHRNVVSSWAHYMPHTIAYYFISSTWLHNPPMKFSEFPLNVLNRLPFVSGA